MSFSRKFSRDSTESSSGNSAEGTPKNLSEVSLEIATEHSLVIHTEAPPRIELDIHSEIPKYSPFSKIFKMPFGNSFKITSENSPRTSSRFFKKKIQKISINFQRKLP